MINTTNQPKTQWSQFGVLISVFFFWGFVAASNGIFIPFCKSHFNLSQFESQLIDTAFYGAYFFGSLILFLISTARGKDYLNQIGYKKGIVFGLLISILGAFGLLFAVQKETQKPIADIQNEIFAMKTDNALKLTDGLLTIKKTATEYALIASKSSESEKYRTDETLLSLVDGKAFTIQLDTNRFDSKVVDTAGYKAIISTENLKTAVTHLGSSKFNSSVTYGTFGLILLAFFVLALGFSLQQTSAQPFAVSMGSEATGAHRLNMAGGINSLGTLLGPIFVSLILFGSIAAKKEATIGNVKVLYYLLIALFAVAALIFSLAKLPKNTSDEEVEKSNKALSLLLVIACLFPLIIMADYFSNLLQISKIALVTGSMIVTLGLLLYANVASKKNAAGWGAMQYPQLLWGMLGIYVYVGVEVAIQSNFGALLITKAFGTYKEGDISHFIAMYWGSMMIGRWTGAVSVFNLPKAQKKLAMAIVPFVAFALVLGVNYAAGKPISELFPYIGAIVVLVLANMWSKESPIRMMYAFATLGALAMVIGIFTEGKLATYCFISGGLFCSVMWPCIFSLSITGLGKYTSQGSAFLIMMILGGAVIPPLQGAVADTVVGIHQSYWIPVACFIFLILYTLVTQKTLAKQGLEVGAAAGGH